MILLAALDIVKTRNKIPGPCSKALALTIDKDFGTLFSNQCQCSQIEAQCHRLGKCALTINKFYYTLGGVIEL